MLVFENIKKNLKKELKIEESDPKIVRNVGKRRSNLMSMMYGKPKPSNFMIFMIM